MKSIQNVTNIHEGKLQKIKNFWTSTEPARAWAKQNPYPKATTSAVTGALTYPVAHSRGRSAEAKDEEIRKLQGKVNEKKAGTIDPKTQVPISRTAISGGLGAAAALGLGAVALKKYMKDRKDKKDRSKENS